MNLVTICGERGVGKTTFLRAQLAALTADGRTAGGVVSAAVFEGGRRAGYDLIDVHTGCCQPLARVVDPAEGVPDVGAFQFDAAAVAAGNAAMIAAVRDGLDFVVIDEVGPLEFHGKGWARAVETALRECRPPQTLIIVVRPSLADELPERFPSDAWNRVRRIVPPWPESLGS